MASIKVSADVRKNVSRHSEQDYKHLRVTSNTVCTVLEGMKALGMKVRINVFLNWPAVQNRAEVVWSPKSLIMIKSRLWFQTQGGEKLIL